MEILISALVGELVTRSMSSIIKRYSDPPTHHAVEVRFERILLRGQVIVDEAAGRRITNLGMLRQVTMVRDAMYRGHYALDAFRCRALRGNEPEDGRQAAASLSRPAPKLLRLSSGGGGGRKALQDLEEALDGLRTMVHDAGETVLFLATCPRLHRQPYSMHLLLDRCMFGRQMEMQLVISFLLCGQPPSNGVDRFDVLPVVGPARVGKSTLVAHVCKDERIRDHFSQIMFLSHDTSGGGEDITTLISDRCAPGHENDGRSLVVVDIAGELDDGMHGSLRSLCRQSTTAGSKIIITSRSDKITKLGTAPALTLNYLSHEAFWYFFKVTTFGSSTASETHPKLVRLAMEITGTLNGNLVAANIMARVMRSNLDIHFWSKVLAFRRGYVHDHLSKFGEHPFDLIKENRVTHLQRIGASAEDVLVLDQYQTCSSQEEVPKVEFQDLLCGSFSAHGRFKVLTWKSRIPPYHSYICTCEIRELQGRVVKRKRSPMNDARHF